MPGFVRWTEWDGTGLEHSSLALSGNGAVLEGSVVGRREGVPYGAHYRIVCDREWRTREVRLVYVGAFELHVEADGHGGWFDRLSGGARLAALDGCLDVDLGISPSTNTLPIRRLGLGDGASRAIRAAYVPLPAEIEAAAGIEGASCIEGARLLPRPSDQRYTCLEAGRRYRYESLDADFTAVLAVDDRGVVLDYPGLFRRRS